MTLTDSIQAEKRIADNKKLIIGLDFGAAFTKVIIGDNRVRYAVPFAGYAHPDNQYLLPSILDINENNICGLSSSNQSAANNFTRNKDNLKLPLLDNTYTDEDLLRVSAYLALVFRATKDWLLDRYQERYGHTKLTWSINAGLPADNSNYLELSDLYKKLIHTAWIISVLPGPVTLNRVRQYMGAEMSAFDAFPAVYRSRIISKDRINTFPGCSAQICGYVHSKKCSDGLHMLIDIGAGTINIATFNTFSNIDENTNGNKCELYACTVEPIGVSYLLKRRYENLKLPDNDINLFKDIPDTRAFSQAHDLTEKDIKFADTLYSGDAARLINKIMDITKTQYCPDSSQWESGVLTFTCGGGVHMEIIQNIMHSFEKKSPPHKIHSLVLSVPDDLMVENLPEGSFDRLSVAYGLSFDPAEIGKAIKEETIRNIKETIEA